MFRFELIAGNHFLLLLSHFFRRHCQIGMGLQKLLLYFKFNCYLIVVYELHATCNHYFDRCDIQRRFFAFILYLFLTLVTNKMFAK